MTDPRIRLIHAYTPDPPPAPGELVVMQFNGGTVSAPFHVPRAWPDTGTTEQENR